MKRLENENFEDYKIRRKEENAFIDQHLDGIYILNNSGTNRKELRTIQTRSKHFGSDNKYYWKRVKSRRSKK